MHPKEPRSIMPLLRCVYVTWRQQAIRDHLGLLDGNTGLEFAYKLRSNPSRLTDLESSVSRIRQWPGCGERTVYKPKDAIVTDWAEY